MLQFAAQSGFPTVCAALGAAGANLEAANSSGVTALIAAVQNAGDEAGKLATVEALLAAGAKVNAATNKGFAGGGRTACYFALGKDSSGGNFPTIVAALRAAGATK